MLSLHLHHLVNQKNEDDEFFEQEPLKDNRALMTLIWEGIKCTYKKIKVKNKKRTTIYEDTIRGR